MQASTLESCPCFIGGEWVPGEQGSHDIHSPHTGLKIGSYSVPSPAQIQLAIEKAHSAQKDWGRLPIKERSRVLYNFRNILLRELDAISRLKSSECGKTFEEGKQPTTPQTSRSAVWIFKLRGRTNEPSQFPVPVPSS